MMWIVLALLSAFLTAVTATLAKIALKDVDSNLGLALQSIIVLAVAWAVVAFQGKVGDVKQIDRSALIYLALSGVVSGIAYLCYFGAIKQGDVSKAAPVDRLSLVFSIILAGIFLSEKITLQIGIGGGLMAIGAIIVALAKPGGH